MDQLPPGPAFAGVDVSKDRLDVHLRPSGRSFAVPRDGQGLEQLLVVRARRMSPNLSARRPDLSGRAGRYHPSEVHH